MPKFKICGILYVGEVMQIHTTQDTIYIDDAQYFDPEATLTSGQVFRFDCVDNVWTIRVQAEFAQIYQISPSKYKILCSNPNFFVNYFDFFTKYDNIINSLSKFDELADCMEYGKGVRMLRQPLLEVIINFIISANNNIPRIRKSLDMICSRFGSPTNFGYAFPTLDELLNISIMDFEECGCGYRAKYLVDTIRILATTDLLTALPNMSTAEARRELIALPGIGPKVADCILLFGLYKFDVFPVDTWVQKIYTQDYHGTQKSRTKIADFFVSKYGELSGYAQQYLFYHKRKDIKLI